MAETGGDASSSSTSALPLLLPDSGILSREQLIHVFHRFTFLTSQLDVKKRIADAVDDKQEPDAVTTAIQEGIFLEMGIDPRFGIAFLGKVTTVYESDMDLMIQFYRFIAKEEMVCDEAELSPNEFSKKLHAQQQLQAQQLEMLKKIRKFHPDVQSSILETLRRQMENGIFNSTTLVLTSEQIQEVVQMTAVSI